MDISRSYSIILLCGGRGKRMQLSTPKQFLNLNKIPMALYSLKVFSFFSPKELCVVCKEEFTPYFEKELGPLIFAKPGKRRQDSVENGLLRLTEPVSDVIIHDAARPFLKRSDLLNLLLLAGKHEAAALAIPSESTIRITDESGHVISTPHRSSVWQIQTPQLVSYSLLKEGLEVAKQKGLELTDDVAAAELLGKRPILIEGAKSNIKITTQEDLAYAEFYCKHHHL